jgi:hypothetical protein
MHQHRHFQNSLKKHLFQVFRYHLSAGKEITVNGDPLSLSDPLHADLTGVKVFRDETYDFQRDAKARSTRLRNVQTELARLGVDGRRELRAIDAQPEYSARRSPRRA